MRESANAFTKKKFIDKLSVALKETDETIHWLEFLHQAEYIDMKIYKPYHWIATNESNY